VRKGQRLMKIESCVAGEPQVLRLRASRSAQDDSFFSGSG
jgi:hypothetical protein